MACRRLPRERDVGRADARLSLSAGALIMLALSFAILATHSLAQ